MADGRRTQREETLADGTERVSTVVLVVDEKTNPRRSREIMRWIRALLPAALIMVSSAPVAADAPDDVITVRIDEPDAGPLAVAAELARPRGVRE
jgi:hypothetical protein